MTPAILALTPILMWAAFALIREALYRYGVEAEDAPEC